MLLPVGSPGSDLPVASVLPALTDALRGAGAAVLVAPPGTGKTTLVPLALAAVALVVLGRRWGSRAGTWWGAVLCAALLLDGGFRRDVRAVDAEALAPVARRAYLLLADPGARRR